MMRTRNPRTQNTFNFLRLGRDILYFVVLIILKLNLLFYCFICSAVTTQSRSSMILESEFEIPVQEQR